MSEESVRIDDLPAKCAVNSERWFPHLHDRNITTTEEHLKHLGLGLAEEAGETVGVIKKMTGYAKGQAAHSGPINVTRAAEELADVLVYAFNIYALLGYKPSDALAAVEAKCNARWGAE